MNGVRRRAGLFVAPALLLLGGCGGEVACCGPEVPEDPVVDSIAIPAWGTAATFDLATWNLNFFGSPSGGPSDDDKQLQRVREVISGSDADLWGVQEVSDGGDFATLASGLTGYSALLANDPSVTDGAAFYSDFNNTELKVGIVYKTAAVEVLSARLILTDLDFEFAGRPPLEIRVRITISGDQQEAVLVVLHAKASSDVPSWERRSAAATGLKAYLDETWPDEAVFVIGDFNDDVDESITPGQDTPYRSFIEDAQSWTFATATLTAAGENSILGFNTMIDHILGSNEAMAWYSAGSVDVYDVDELIPQYKNSVSDHLPVLAQFLLGS
jgi:endonuclease/exonuclease/phosphatase family metal-dependent hydrolase